MTISNHQLRDLTDFASRYFIIRTKNGKPSLFKFNRAQLYIHAKLEKQLADKRKIRSLILKGRQQGCSTYIQARYFHKIITNKGLKAFILTHETEATKNLFEMTQRYYDKLPSGLCPVADKSSSKELHFSCFDSGYAVGTAGNKGAGRSQTIQLFHGSEVGFWPNAEDHAKGVLQAVSGEANTEIILESTANGIGNYFHNMWLSAVERQSEYQAIFIPWYWQNEYTAPDTGIMLSEEENELMKYYGKDGLTNAHLAWRRLKIAELSNDPDIGGEYFKQEFPFSANEAFLNPVTNVLIQSKFVTRARSNSVESESRLIIGVDVAIGNKDKAAIIRRKGRLAYQLETFRNYNTMELAGLIKNICDKEDPYRVYIDCIGIGAGVVDRLKEMGYNFVEGVNVARTANDKDRYKNLRHELWITMSNWLAQEMPVQVPDDDELHGHLCSVGYKKPDSNGRIVLESKYDLLARGMPSPDCADALSLTFYSGMYETDNEYAITKVIKPPPGMFI